ncbi:MAG: hypothetical protein MMC23_004172 [Stictis urceolatum]|nr:hypothetical protein [Stictis urceolata]
MSDDASYSSFLDKANQDTSTPHSSSTSKPQPLEATDVSASSIPAPLKSLDATYTSDADEPFEPVSLSFSGKSLTKRAFKELVGHDKEVEEMSVEEWDPRGGYKEVVGKVKEVVREVKVFRAETEGARVEYWVVGLAEGRVLGVRARAVES